MSSIQNNNMSSQSSLKTSWKRFCVEKSLFDDDYSDLDILSSINDHKYDPNVFPGVDGSLYRRVFISEYCDKDTRRQIREFKKENKENKENKYTVKQLKELCKKLSISTTNLNTKDKLIEAVKIYINKQ